MAMRLPMLLAAALVFGATAAAAAAEFTPAQKGEIEATIKDYLLKNPEVLRDAMLELDKRQKQDQADAREKIVSDSKGLLFSSPHQANIGNPAGGATIVEFFDYNCHFCKGALPDMAKLVKGDPNLKIVLKDFPVLGPGSVEAAQVASAVRNQISGDKFWQFHSKLLGMHGPIGKMEALSVARDLGVDMDRLNKDMDSPDVKSGLEEVMHMADSLQINGTPTFVVGQELVVGAVGYDALKGKVDNIHKCGKTDC